jgi:2-polyprenyl-6-methoxyphenol hydroxylase-like FAD-dependent oxidoreductase
MYGASGDESMETTDVVIVGAGPAGLMLANWLVRLGTRVFIADSKAGPTRESRALIVQVRSLEVYDQLGIPAAAHGQRVDGITLWQGHRRIANLQIGALADGLTPYPYPLVLEQSRNETLLYEHLLALGGTVHWRTRFTGLTTDSDGITATFEREEGGTQAVRARYICGADGAHSPLRHLLEIPFPGSSNAGKFYVADVHASGSLEAGRANFNFGSADFALAFPMDDRDHVRLIGVVPPLHPGAAAISFADVQPHVEGRLGVRVHSVEWFATFAVNHRVAAAFRRGRAFLLGDAAHAHSPVGGQGMNTGLLDAQNLAWKLAAVIRGDATEHLLDSYEAERQPFARTLVRTTDRAFGLITARNPAMTLLRGRLIPLILGLLFQRTPTASPAPAKRGRRGGLPNTFFGIIGQIGIAYPRSPLSGGRAGRVRGGDRLPFVPLGTSSNFAALRDAAPQIHVYGTPAPGLRDWCARHPAFHLHTFPYTRAARAAGLAEGATYLVRPDGYVSLALAEFDEVKLSRMLREGWGWRSVA